MRYTLPDLPYAYDALEPYIDAKTMEIHHTKHHQGYIDKLNAALEPYKELQDRPLFELLSHLQSVPEAIRTAVRNQGGGHANHTLFWMLMSKNGGGAPRGTFATAINQIFGSFEAFQAQFNTLAQSVFGSGWAWVCRNEQGQLILITTPNQDSPLSQGLQPVMGLDVWEHAYYLHYQNRRPDYINAWWHVVNWDQVEENYCALIE